MGDLLRGWPGRGWRRFGRRGVTYHGSVGGTHEDRPDEYSVADFVPDEFESIPPHASTETKWLYLQATAVQLGQIIASVWGLNRLSKPGLSAPDKIFTVVIMIIAIVVCVQAWSTAYHSAADDRYLESLRRPNSPE
jgi:hypothetical protein